MKDQKFKIASPCLFFVCVFFISFSLLVFALCVLVLVWYVCGVRFLVVLFSSRAIIVLCFASFSKFHLAQLFNR